MKESECLNKGGSFLASFTGMGSVAVKRRATAMRSGSIGPYKVPQTTRGFLRARRSPDRTLTKALRPMSAGIASPLESMSSGEETRSGKGLTPRNS